MELKIKSFTNWLNESQGQGQGQETYKVEVKFKVVPKVFSTLFDEYLNVRKLKGGIDLLNLDNWLTDEDDVQWYFMNFDVDSINFNGIKNVKINDNIVTFEVIKSEDTATIKEDMKKIKILSQADEQNSPGYKDMGGDGDVYETKDGEDEGELDGVHLPILSIKIDGKKVA